MLKRSALIVVFIGLFGQAQSQESYTQYNFENIDPKTVDIEKLRELLNKRRQSLDSTFSALKLDSLSLLYNYLSEASMNYVTPTFAIETMTADYGSLQRDLALTGLPGLPSTPHVALAIGITARTNRTLIEYLINLYFGVHEKQGGALVRVRGANLVNFSIGYDVLNKKHWQLYGIATLNQQFTNIDIQREPTSQTPTSDLASITTQYSDIDMRKSSWRIGPAVELDYRFFHARKQSGTIVGLRFGLSYTFAEGKYKINGSKVDYDPGLDLRKSYLAVIFKPFQR
jgi:hypothetical protein